MPAATSNSSVSPARRMEHQRASLPFTQPSQNPFAYPHVLQSPQNYGNGFGQPGIYTTPAGDSRRACNAYPLRDSLSSTPIGLSSGILPTPDPTVGSCMSEEDKDVALQLMRLGDMSNISHGRTSASTLDDTFSGRADAASSTGATSEDDSESEVDLPPARRQKREPSPILPPNIRKYTSHVDDGLPSQDSTEHSGDDGDYEDGRDGTFKLGRGEFIGDLEHRSVKPKISRARSASGSVSKSRSTSSGAKASKTSKLSKARAVPTGKTKTKAAPSVGNNRPPMSPTSLPAQSRKTSVASALNFQHQLAEDEEDLSSKPRCQRCRKSKKGCDRQRPCQRCKDAGLSADQCVSEDEGNGRKGRYGRHMGVPVKKEDLAMTGTNNYPELVAGGQASPDKSKKRKR